MNKYRITIPSVDVPENVNYTRRLRILIKGDVRLDIRLDELDYQYEFDIPDGTELRVESAIAGERWPEAITMTSGKQKEYIGTHFDVHMLPPDVDEDPFVIADEPEDYTEFGGEG